MAVNDMHSPFQLGEIAPGKQAVDPNIILNQDIEGKEFVFPVTEEVAQALGMDDRIIGRRICGIIFRNTTGAVLVPGKLYVIDPAAGVKGMGKLTGEAGAGDRYCYVCDPMLKVDVPEGDLCYGIVHGPTKVWTGAAGTSTTAGGMAAAGAAGAVAVAADPSNTLLGTFFETQTASADYLVDIDLTPTWW